MDTGEHRPARAPAGRVGAEDEDARLTRRQLLAGAGVLGLSLTAAAPLLAACSARAGSATTASAAPRPTPTPRLTEPLTIEGGRIVGLARGRVRAFLGIPYAAPPVGELRWRPPRAVAAWQGVRQCTAYGLSCPQDVAAEDNESLVDRQSEDCLYLNVWTAARSAEEPLPVMLWIHGGGFISGSGALPATYGERLSGEEHVVLVSINYRLGAFGFFAHPALSAESPDGVSGNYGLLDQIAALRWVRRNIAAVGGDPRRVTVFGQSAGAQSVTALLVSPLSRGLFARAVSQSARYQDQGVGIWSTRTLAQQEALGLAVAGTLGAPAGSAGLAALRRLPADRLAAATAPATGPLPLLCVLPPQPSFQPVVDGHVLPAEPWRLIERGRWARVPLLVGSNRDEANMWLAGLGGSLAGSVVRASQARMSWYAGSDWPALAARFPAARYGGRLAAMSRLMSVLEFNAPARFTAACAARQGVPAYLYYFSRTPHGDPKGAHHSAEIAHVFDSLNPARLAQRPQAADLALATQIADYWSTFARTGDPNGPGRPRWPRYDPAADVVLRLDAPVRTSGAPYAAASTLAEQVNRRH